MLTSGDRLALLPALLLLGALAGQLLPVSAPRLRRGVSVTALLAGLLLAASLLPAVAGNATVQRSFGNAVPGVELVLRGDAPGLVIAATGLVAALFVVAGNHHRRLDEAAIMLCAASSAIAGLAGNAVLLFGAAEIGTIASLLLVARRGRVGRGALVAFGVQHVCALGLLLAAVDLVAIAGTSDPRSLPPGVISAQLGLPWALAGAARLLGLGLGPGAGEARVARAWTTISAVPCGAAILLRLIEAGAGPLSLGISIPLGVAGAATALWGGFLAWHWRRDPRLAGQGLVVAATGPVIALAGLPGGAGGFAAGLVALELILLAAPAWDDPVAGGRWGRPVAAVALAAAGGIPVGFGATASILELGPIAALGPRYLGLLAALGVAALVAAMAGLAAARHALGPPGTGAGPVPGAAIAALGVGGVSALLPGLAGLVLLNPLAGAAAPAVVDLASLRGPGGAWPGGYLSLGLLIAVSAIVSAGIAMGWNGPRHTLDPPGSGLGLPWPRLLRPRRRLAPLMRGLPRALSSIDHWLIPQPQLGFAVFAAVIALFLFR